VKKFVVAAFVTLAVMLGVSMSVALAIYVPHTTTAHAE
jgi:hypothetical protein